MHTFRVWAPNAKTVQVKLGSALHDLQKQDRGYWGVSVGSAGHGSDYQYVVDGAEPLPDPQTPWQPYGVNGASRILDHSVFQWTDQFWQPRPLGSAVVYELHIGTFTPKGTFESAIEYLDHLTDLGITHVELLPVNEFSGDWGWGYDGVDLFAPHHQYGGPEGLKKLVNACHAKGLAVIMDVVYNHLGPTGNYLSRFGPYFTDAYATPWGSAVNLDHAGSHEVRRFFCDNALMWLRDYHIDGLRLDAIHAYFDKSAIHLLEQLSVETAALSAQLGKHFVLIAESDLNDTRVVASREAGGFGMHAQWSDDFHHALHSVLTGERDGYYEDFGSLKQLAAAIKDVFVYGGEYSPHRDRVHGRPVEKLPAHRFLAYLQNHDQIGNRARGERSSHLLSLDRLKIGAALVLTSPCVPMLFQGEEWGASTPFQYFTHHEDQELGRAVSEGRRNEFKAFGWNPDDVPDPQSTETFERSKLKWEERSQEPHREIFEWHRQLIGLRFSGLGFADGELHNIQVSFSETDSWLIVERPQSAVAVNLADKEQQVQLTWDADMLLSSATSAKLNGQGLVLPPNSVAIVKQRAAKVPAPTSLSRHAQSSR